MDLNEQCFAKKVTIKQEDDDESHLNEFELTNHSKAMKDSSIKKRKRCKIPPGKPPYSYAALVTMAITSSPYRQMTLAEILEFIYQNFPYYRTWCPKKWKAIIGRQLITARFVKLPRDTYDQYWTVVPSNDVIISDKAKRPRERSGNHKHQRTSVPTISPNMSPTVPTDPRYHRIPVITHVTSLSRTTQRHADDIFQPSLSQSIPSVHMYPAIPQYTEPGRLPNNHSSYSTGYPSNNNIRHSAYHYPEYANTNVQREAVLHYPIETLSYPSNNHTVPQVPLYPSPEPDTVIQREVIPHYPIATSSFPPGNYTIPTVPLYPSPDYPDTPTHREVIPHHSTAIPIFPHTMASLSPSNNIENTVFHVRQHPSTLPSIHHHYTTSPLFPRNQSDITKQQLHRPFQPRLINVHSKIVPYHTSMFPTYPSSEEVTPQQHLYPHVSCQTELGDARLQSNIIPRHPAMYPSLPQSKHSNLQVNPEIELLDLENQKMVIFVRLFNHSCVVLSFGNRQECSGEELKREILKNECLPTELGDCMYLSHNGHILSSDSTLQLDQCDSCIACHVRLLGGKGGFGSMLRAIGAQIEKTTNREACRDLSGRRMRDVNDEQKIADWLSKKSEREEEKAKLKKERLEKLRSTPKHVFEDSSKYTSELQKNVDSVEDSLQRGLKSASSTTSTSSLGKRKADEKSRKKHSKKQKLWLGIDEDMSSESDEESDAGSSCSSVSCDMGSEASSRISSSLGQTSESEEHMKENATKSIPPGLGDKVSSTATSSTSTSSSVASASDDKKIQAIEKETEEKTTSVDVDGREAKSDTEKSIPFSMSEPLDLDQYDSKEDLEALGLGVLKSSLMVLGLKCGGTLQQRAERLFSTKGIPREMIDPSLLAKAPKKQRRNGK